MNIANEALRPCPGDKPPVRSSAIPLAGYEETMTIEELIQKSKFVVLLGKNGSGKSSQLRALNARKSLNTKYISPERGGTLKYNPNVDNNMSNSESWLDDTRQKNRFEQFREQSAVQFRNLELLVLREIEQEEKKRKDTNYSFDVILGKINSLLPAIKLIRSDKGFSIQSKSGTQIQEEAISSGESELIALAIEVLVFSRSSTKEKVLLLDEPDVHLHPDLQHKFVEFIESVAQETDMRVVIATHSTAIIGAFSNQSDLSIVPISSRDQAKHISFKRSRVCDEIIPVFGAHPLSSVFNLSPVILVEGDDDKRVLEQLTRSSNGKVKLSPCVVGTVSELNTWENWLNQFLPVLYDSPVGYSLRDLDGSQQTDIEDNGVVRRIRLNCYAIENILITDQCLSEHGFTPSIFKDELERWHNQYPNHKFAGDVEVLIGNFDNRRTIKVKNIRNIIVALLNTNKPWEVIVGQSIASNLTCSDSGEHSIKSYLGVKFVTELLS